MAGVPGDGGVGGLAVQVAAGLGAAQGAATGDDQLNAVQAEGFQYDLHHRYNV
jgi:hypothetical protein